jgi:molybdopterin-containing oxidoreductase family iron-sulfur binding subunit
MTVPKQQGRENWMADNDKTRQPDDRLKLQVAPEVTPQSRGAACVAPVPRAAGPAPAAPSPATAGSGQALKVGATLAENEPKKRFWRGLDELAETEEYKDFLRHEYPYGAIKEVNTLGRRDVLKLMAASAAFAGLTACTKLPTEKIVPYAQQAPEEFIPGKPLFYATAMPFGGVGTGLLVESHMGRPTKVEGNPGHPASLGAADIFAQASVLGLYDPDRSQVAVRNGRIGSWSAFLTAMDELRLQLIANKGAGFRLLTETVTSPALAEQIHSLLAQFPSAKWHQFEPCGRDAAREGSRLAFGEYVSTVYRFDQADVVLSLDSDFLSSGPGSLRYAHDFAGKRRISDPQSTMNRLYVVESTPSATGAMADHRLPLRASDVEAFACAVAEGLGVKALSGAPSKVSNLPSDWVPALIRDLQQLRGASLVVAGDQQPPVVHALAHAMNEALGNVGKTVYYTAPIEANPVNQLQSLRELVSEIEAGQVDVLVMLGGNPVFTAPADAQFREKLLEVGLRIHLGQHEDETAEFCHWHIPEAHYLESWGDVRAFDGTVSVIQPLIAPLYEGKSPHELLSVLLGQAGRQAHAVLQDYWKRQTPGANFETTWKSWLNEGVVAGTALPPKAVKLVPDFQARLSPNAAAGHSQSRGLEIIFRPDPAIWDGRFANNGWLQELPKPLTKLTWDNAAMLSLATAERLGVKNGEMVKLRFEGREVQAPIWVMPGHADESVTVHLGHGRREAGKVGSGIGFNAYAIRPSSAPWFGSGLEIAKTGDQYSLATTQHHHIITGQNQKKEEEESVAAARRDLVRVAAIEEFRKNPDFAKDSEEQTTHAPSLYPGFKDEGYSWGMAIDLNSCTGCNACVVACQSENNIPVVGKEQVARGREMHWIRVDTYFRGALENPETYHEIVLCMQCENAPCESVCPVGATVHSPEGLNEMVYNRCVGTRYCSNNCPYKVRRFNFKLFQDWTTPSLVPMRNPNVTVRSRGVMEKCTYCIQRINARKIEAEEQNREVRDGEILTACQQTCPTQAIVFGNIKDPNSRVSKLRAQSRNYTLLTDLNTRPRTTYLARLRNPNPEIKE